MYGIGYSIIEIICELFTDICKNYAALPLCSVHVTAFLSITSFKELPGFAFSDNSFNVFHSLAESYLFLKFLDLTAVLIPFKCLSKIVLCCFVLFCFCFVLFCFVLFCFVLFCFVLFCFVLFCFVLFFVFSLHNNQTLSLICERSCLYTNQDEVHLNNEFYCHLHL